MAENKERNVTAAEKAYLNAKNAADDAQRSYDKTQNDLDRAKRDAVKNAQDALSRAVNALSDARRSYDKTLTDRERAERDYEDNNAVKLENASKTYEDSLKQLQSAKNSLESARNSLAQTQAKPESSEISVELQELNLARLKDQLAEGVIVSTADGVVTESNIKVGASPNGILYVVEDTDDLYVSANIKEYNLPSVLVGQDAYVTAEATGDAVYNAVVSYISPKAVSPAGSTSVEFEARARLNGAGGAVKIGMNAFINIVSDTREDVYAAPLSAVVNEARGQFIYTVGEAGQRIEIPVIVGLKTSTMAEIISDGLYEGMPVVARPGAAEEQNTQGFGIFGRMRF